MNYYETGRTNFFPVKDATLFTSECDRLGIKHRAANGSEGTLYALFNDGESAWATNVIDYEEEVEDFDILDFIQGHIADDAVAVVMIAGSEGMRYVTGVACAVNSKGDRVSVNLYSIYDQAAKLGTLVTLAEY